MSEQKDSDFNSGEITNRGDIDELEFEKLNSEDEDSESSPPDYEITTYPADFTLEVLNQKWIQQEIVIPEFQRDFVWTQNQSSKLIESFLLGLPVPSVFLYNETETNKYLVIDGQQRLKSIFSYFKGIFGDYKEKNFKLTGLNENSSYFNKTFDNLDEKHKLKFKNSILRAFIIQQLNPDDDTSKFHIYERLNTGGTHLANQEIRNCIYHGHLINELRNMNENGNWRKILGKNAPDKRAKDIELLLRFFAMRDISKYRKPLKEYLNNFMKNNRDVSTDILQSMKSIFEKTCDEILDKLGEKPFHIRSGLNAAVFDAVLTAFSNHLDKIPPDAKIRFNDLIRNSKFVGYTSSGTTGAESIRGRFALTSEIIFDEKA